MNFDNLVEDLKRQLYYDSETGLFTRLISNTSAVNVGDVAGARHKTGYYYIKFNGKLYLAHRLAWLYIHGVWPVKNIDHINGNKSDNRIVNLREATKQDNGLNRGKPLNNTSGYKGVVWHKQMGKWLAQCVVRGKRYSLGLFDDIELAAKTYQDFAKKHHGVFYHE